MLVRAERRGAVEVVTLDRPPLNALSGDLIEMVQAAFEGVAREPDVRAVVLTGSERAFSAGADVRELGGLAPGAATRAWIERGQELCELVAGFNRPVVAAIEGYCLGGGLELALACHLRVAGADAQLGLPEIKLGIFPGFGGTQRLPRLVGPATALELMLTGDPIPAERALALGLVNRVVESGQALIAAEELATTIASRSATAAAAILRLVQQPVGEGLARELEAVSQALASPDGREGTTAFREKREPSFRSPPP